MSTEISLWMAAVMSISVESSDLYDQNKCDLSVSE